MTAVNQKQYMDRIEVGQSFVHPVTNENMEVLGKIGTGASANVFKIADSEGKLHALKSINYGRNDLMRELAESELKLMQKLEHSHIVRFEGAIRAPGAMHIIMELAQENLLSYINKLPEKTLSCDQLKKVLVDVVHALEYIHGEGVIHRDIKPENVLLVGRVWKICDFGVSSGEDLGKTFIGTSSYLAPEILSCINEDNLYTVQVDIWALGVMLFEAYFGVHPFLLDPEANRDFEGPERLYSSIRILTEGGFRVEKSIKMFENNHKQTEAEYMRRKLARAEPVISDFFREVFQMNVYNRLTPSGIFSLFNRNRPIKMLRQRESLPNIPEKQLIPYHTAKSMEQPSKPHTYAQIVFLTSTIDLMSEFYRNEIVAKQIAALQFMLLKRFNLLEEAIDYSWKYPNEIQAYRNTDKRQAKLTICNLLMGRVSKLKKSPYPTSPINEEIFRLLICAALDEIVLNVRYFAGILTQNIPTEEFQAFEDYAQSRHIEIEMLEIIQSEIQYLISKG